MKLRASISHLLVDCVEGYCVVCTSGLLEVIWTDACSVDAYQARELILNYEA